MSTIQFTGDPAQITIADGLTLAARYWRATADLWTLPVAIVAAVTAVAATAATAVPDLGSPAGGPPIAFAPGMDPMAVIGPLLPQLLVSAVVVGPVALVAGWVYLAIAIAGLRGYRVMPGWILRRGVRAFAADLLVTIAFGTVFAILALFSIAGGTGLVVVVMVTAFVPAIYLSIRLIFWSLAIFDGAGIIGGLHATWGISRGAVARMLGWGVMVAVVGLVIRGAAELVTLPLGDGNAVRTGIIAAVSEAFAAYAMIALAVIYESQRRIHVGWVTGTAYGPPPGSPPAGRPPADGRMEPPPPGA